MDAGNFRKGTSLFWLALLTGEESLCYREKDLLNKVSFIDATDPEGAFNTGQEISLTQEARGACPKTTLWAPQRSGLQLKYHDSSTKSTWSFWGKCGMKEPGGGLWKIILLFK